MDQHYDIVNLVNIARGAAVELWDEGVKKAVANIKDPNTSAKAKRKITMTLELAPDETRESAMYTIKVEEKLASARGVTSQIYFATQDGEPVLSEFNPRQPGLYGDNGGVN